MAIAWIQTATLGSAGTATSQATNAFGSNPTVGNYIAVGAFGWAGSHAAQIFSGFTDTGGNSYTVPTNASQFIANDLWCAVGFAKVVTSGSSFTVTAATGSTSSSIMVAAAEFSGIPASSPQDGTASGTAPGTTATSFAPGNMTIQSGSLVFAVMVNDDTTNPAAIDGVTSGSPGTPPSGFTALGTQYNSSAFEAGQVCYAIGPTSPSNPTWTTTDAACKWAAVQLALLAAAGGGTGGPQQTDIPYPNFGLAGEGFSRPVAQGWL